MRDSIDIREAVESDASRIAEIFRVVYGDGYVHPRLYEEREIKRMIFDRDTLVLVAEDAAADRLVGSASVLFVMGAYSDLVGEFGRLVVHPEYRSRGIGTRLMEERLSRIGGRLHVGFAEVRVGTPHSARISQRHGFVPVGILPQKLVFGGEREHAAYLVRHFGDALALRKNHPRIIPESHRLAELALDGVGIAPDVVIDEDAPPYPPPSDALDLEELTERAYASLLRIQRGRVRNREVFGPQRLHYGLSELAASHSSYIVARDGDREVGALGYTRHDAEKSVRVFEIINAEEEAVRFLLEALETRCVEDGLKVVEIDVSAHAPRMQRTLLEMGYVPTAYVPALAFDEVERVDVVKMCRLIGGLQDLPFEAPEPTLSVGRHVLDQLARRQVLPRLARAIDRLEICRGLTEEQTSRLLGEFTTRVLKAGSTIFGQGEPADRMILVIDGRARVEMEDRPVGSVGPGESLGEVALLTGSDHSATAVAETEMELAVLAREELDGLVRRRPDIGAVVYRNLARELGAKLRRADQAVLDEP